MFENILKLKKNYGLDKIYKNDTNNQNRKL